MKKQKTPQEEWQHRTATGRFDPSIPVITPLDLKGEILVLEETFKKWERHFAKHGPGSNRLTRGSSVALENLTLRIARLHDMMTGSKVDKRSRRNGDEVGAVGRAEQGLRAGLGYEYP